jgi:signal transduction histidine kinase
MSSSFDTIYKKMASSLESGGAGQMHEAKSDTARHISPVVAHELNNLLTIIQGYADRLLLKHGEDPAIEANLKLISEASRRAATLVRSARNQETNPPPHPQSAPPPLVPAV